MAKSKVGLKLIAVVGCTIFITIAIFAYAIINSYYRELILHVTEGAHQLSETVKSGTKYDMLANHRDKVHRTIDAVAEQEGIEKVRIFNKEGEIIYSSARDEMGGMVDKQAEACYACHTADQPLEALSISERTRRFINEDQTQNLGIINPVYNEPSCWQAACHAHDSSQKVLGVLDITMSLESVDKQVGEYRIKLVIFAVTVIALLSLLLWFAVRHLISKPVNRLLEATNIVSSGDLSHKIPVKTNDELGNLARAFNTMTDKLSEAQRQVYQQDKLASLGRLAAGVAHEINNPLTGIMTYASLMLRESKGECGKEEDLNVIVREAKRCREIVKGLLDFARQAPSRKARLNLNEIINHSLAITDNQLALSNVVVKKHLDDKLPDIVGDANQIQQLLINLIVNGVDAIGKKGGEIVICSEKIEGSADKSGIVQLSVADNGCGMKPEVLNRIFEPFYTTKGQGGTGLGLAVVWGIVEKHEATINVTSDVNKGTKFTIRFPAG